MVIEVLVNWEQVFRAIDVMRGEKIDAFRIHFVSDKTGRETSRLFPVRTVMDFNQYRDQLSRSRPEFQRFTEFKLEAGGDEIVEEKLGGEDGGVLLRVLLIRAS